MDAVMPEEQGSYVVPPHRIIRWGWLDRTVLDTVPALCLCWAGERILFGRRDDMRLKNPYCCPRCGSEDLDVLVEAWARLYQESGEVTGTCTDESRDAAHNWGAESMMECGKCDYQAPSKMFRVDV